MGDEHERDQRSFESETSATSVTTGDETHGATVP